MVFVRVFPAEAGFDRHREVGGTFGVVEAFHGEVGSLNHSSAATGFVDVFVGATEIQIDAGETEFLEGFRTLSEVFWVLAPDLGDDGFIAGGDLKAFQSVFATFL